MAREIIDIGSAANDGEGDPLRTCFTKANTNADLADKLQTATGLTEGSESIGSPGVLTTDAPAAGQTLLQVALAAHGRLASVPLTQADAQRTARELADDYAYKGADESLIGTTDVTSSGTASSLEYPGGAGVYTLEIIRSGGAGGSAGRTMIVRAVKGTSAWLRLKTEGTWGDWEATNSVSSDDLLTTADAARTATALGSGYDWRTLLGSGYYQGTWTQAQHSTFDLPPRPTGVDTTWDLLVIRTGELTGFAVASSYHTLTQDTIDRVHRYVTDLTLGSSGDTAWTVTGWEGISPWDFADRSVLPESFYYYDWWLEKPAALTNTFPTQPKRAQSGWVPTVNITELRPTVTGTTYYVDPIRGSNANDGLSTSTPKLTIASVLSLSPGRILCAPGIYPYSYGPSISATGSLSATASITLEKWAIRPGEVWLTSGEAVIAWTNVGGAQPSCYRNTCQFMTGAADFNVLDEYGMPTLYAEVSTAAECESTPGTWFDNSATVANEMYVHPLTGGAPNSRLVPLRDLAPIQFGQREQVFLDNIRSVGGNSAIHVANATGTPGGGIYGRNCHVRSANQHGVFVRGFQTAVFERTVASGCSNDGFNYIQFDGTVQTDVIVEIHCEGRDNGWLTTLDTGNGTSAHDGCQIIRIGGHYSGNRGPQVADVNGAVSWNVGVEAGASVSHELDGQHAGFQNITGAEGYYYECSSTTNLYDFATQAGSLIYVDRCEFATLSEALGVNIRAYKQL